ICSGLIFIIESMCACIMGIMLDWSIPDIPSIRPLSMAIPRILLLSMVIPPGESAAGGSFGLLHAAEAKRAAITVM
ncbi:MAG: hypothetical protein ABI037_09580, partial [Gemmatimonadales bacterium]